MTITTTTTTSTNIEEEMDAQEHGSNTPLEQQSNMVNITTRQGRQS